MLKKDFLSTRQTEVLNLLRKGLTNGEICRTLNISENTVKTHIACIYKILEVTNRAEAASIDLSEATPCNLKRQRQDIIVTFEKNSDLQQNSFAYNMFCAIIEAMHQYHLFKIRILPTDTVKSDSDYQIKVVAPQGEKNSLFFTLYQDETSYLLWSCLYKLQHENDIKIQAAHIAIQIFRNMTISAANRFEESQELNNNWWYASCYANIKMENRNKEAFSKCEIGLQSLLNAPKKNVYLMYTLTNVYYTAIVEHWVEAAPYTAKIGKIACNAMQDFPYSSYSQFMMALYNILIGNKSEAIAYFVQILTSIPQDVMARRYLTQIYLLVGQHEKAMEMLDENSRYITDMNQQPFQLIAKSFIHLLLGEYDQCEQLSRQILLIHPETPFARLFMVICNQKKGNTEESQKHIQKFKEFHPNLKKNDLIELLKGVTDKQKEDLIRHLDNLD